MTESKPEALFALQIRCEGLQTPEREFRFAATRRFRFDFAWPLQSLAVEIDGGIWSRGRHTRGAGVERDMDKLNLAAVLGWRVLRFSPRHVTSGEAIRLLSQLLKEVS
jgi:very-short-patch-repair endonuclease